MLRLYIPGGNTGRRETFNCKHIFPRLKVQRLRLRDLGMLAELGSKVQRFIILDPFRVIVLHSGYNTWSTKTLGYNNL